MLELLFWVTIFVLFLIVILQILKKISATDDSVARKKRAETRARRKKLHAEYSSFAPSIQKARVINKRRENAGNKVLYYATFEFDDGSRKELIMNGGDYGLLEKGDRGKVRYTWGVYRGFDRFVNSSASTYQNANYIPTATNHSSSPANSSAAVQNGAHSTQYGEKLQLGLQRLSKAGNDPDLLGLALISLHGALEDYFRNWLSTNSSVPPSQREAVLDARQIQWKGLLDLMQQYGSLNDSQRRYILRLNRLRQDVGHGGQFTGTRSELENYADFVRGFVANGSSSASTGDNYNNSSHKKGDDLRFDMRLSSQEAVSGTEKEIKFPHLEKCESCNGEGLDRAKNHCCVCNGNGRIQQSQKLKVTIPAGVGNGTRLRVAGQGDAGMNGASPGDLYIYLYVKEDS